MHSTRDDKSDPYLGRTQDVTSILDEAVAAIPTVFGKLVWIASLRVADQYRYSDLEPIAPSWRISSAIHDLHNVVFGVWLGLGLQEQSKDFTEYLSGSPAGMLLPETREKLIPPCAKEAERCLFETDLAVVLELAER